MQIFRLFPCCSLFQNSDEALVMIRPPHGSNAGEVWETLAEIIQLLGKISSILSGAYINKGGPLYVGGLPLECPSQC